MASTATALIFGTLDLSKSCPPVLALGNSYIFRYTHLGSLSFRLLLQKGPIRSTITAYLYHHHSLNKVTKLRVEC